MLRWHYGTRRDSAAVRRGGVEAQVQDCGPAGTIVNILQTSTTVREDAREILQRL